MISYVLRMRWIFASISVILFLFWLFLLGKTVTFPDDWQGLLRGLNPRRHYPSVIERSRGLVCYVTTHGLHLITKAKAITPRGLTRSVRDFLTGAALAVSAGKTLSAAASGYVPDCTYSTEAAVRLYSTSKFWVALGASCCELGLLKLLYREEHNNRRRNRLLRWFNSSLGWVVLVLLMTIPNGIMPISVLLVCACKLSDTVYVPAILISNFIRPYIVAAMRNSSRLGLTKELCAIQWSTKSKYQPHEGNLINLSNAAELILAVILIFALRFVLVAHTASDDDEDLSIPTVGTEESPVKDSAAVRQKRKPKKS